MEVVSISTFCYIENKFCRLVYPPLMFRRQRHSLFVLFSAPIKNIALLAQASAHIFTTYKTLKQLLFDVKNYS